MFYLNRSQLLISPFFCIFELLLWLSYCVKPLHNCNTGIFLCSWSLRALDNCACIAVAFLIPPKAKYKYLAKNTRITSFSSFFFFFASLLLNRDGGNQRGNKGAKICKNQSVIILILRHCPETFRSWMTSLFSPRQSEGWSIYLESKSSAPSVKYSAVVNATVLERLP